MTELEALRNRLVEYERKHALGQLALGMAHDVGNVLGALQLRLQILRQDPRCRQAQAKNLDAMEGILTEAGELVQRLQGLSRPSRDEATAFDAGEAVRDAVALVSSGLRLQARRRGAELRIEVAMEPRLPRVRAAADDLRRTLVQVLIHACDGLSGRGLIRVLGRRAGGGVILRVEATDTGAAGDASCEIRLPAARRSQRPASRTAPTVLIEP